MIHIFFSLLISMSAFGASTKYSVVQNKLKKIAQENAANAELFELGKSDSGDPILGLKIGDGETPDLLVGTHHGNEYGSTEVAMGAAASFAKNPIAGHTVYVIPVLNVSGYNKGVREERSPSGSVDPNRDYPGPCVTTRSFRLKATKALADFVERKKIVSSATLHTYWPAVLYPWGFSTNDITTSYEATFINLAKAAAVESGYETGNSKELLYAADGAFEDYAFWKNGVWSLLFEMGDSHYPSSGDIRGMIDVNVSGLRRFFEYAPKKRAANHAFTGKCDYSRALRRTHLE